MEVLRLQPDGQPHTKDYFSLYAMLMYQCYTYLQVYIDLHEDCWPELFFLLCERRLQLYQVISGR